MTSEVVTPVQFELPKPKDEFRNYKDSFRHEIVENHYRLMRTHQTVEFVNKMNDKYSFDKPRTKMTIRDAFKVLETYVDSSDPDVRCEHFLSRYLAQIYCVMNITAYPI